MSENSKLTWVACLLAMSCYNETNAATSPPPSSWEDPAIKGTHKTYLGLSYSPAWHHIGKFTIGANDGSTAARYPLLRDSGTFLDSSFNWHVQDPKIEFDNSKLWAMEASVGYRKNYARIELEVGFEKFSTKDTMLQYRNKAKETVYLLAEDLAHGVMSGDTEKLGQALASTSPQDIVAFAQTVGREAPRVDGKVCNKKVAVNDSYLARDLFEAGFPWYKGGEKSEADWSCVDYADVKRESSRGVNHKNAEHAQNMGLSNRFNNVEGSLNIREDHNGECKEKDLFSLWLGVRAIPCNDQQKSGKSFVQKWWENKKTNGGWPGTAKGKINTAQGMAGDLVSNLDSVEKAHVAGILTRTVSGGEVAEIRAVTTTSVMLNACYDLRGNRSNNLLPFGCLGVGTNLVSVSNGHLSAKLAYRLKAGLSYYVTPRMTAFVSGFYHQVLGDEEYYDIPLMHLVNDRSPEGRSKNYGKAFFKMAYTGAEVGVRIWF